MSEQTQTAVETAEPVQTTDDSSEQTAAPGTETTSQEDTPGTDEEYSLDSIPADLRDKVKPFVEKINKDFKSTYTRKFEDLSKKEKEWLAERDQLSTNLNQLQAIAADVLRDPSKLAYYQQMVTGQPGGQFGPGGNPTEEIQTVGDLISYVKKEMNQVRQEAAGYATSKVTEQQTVQRWDLALDKLSATDKKFGKYKELVGNLIKTNPAKYRASYNGRNEEQILSQAFEDFKSMLREDYEEVKQQTLDGMKAKKSQTTLAPTRATATQGEAKKLTKDEIIQKIQAKYGS